MSPGGCLDFSVVFLLPRVSSVITVFFFVQSQVPYRRYACSCLYVYPSCRRPGCTYPFFFFLFFLLGCRVPIRWYQKGASRSIAPGSNECGSLSHCARACLHLSRYRSFFSLPPPHSLMGLDLKRDKKAPARAQ